MSATLSLPPQTVVLHTGGLHYATEKAVVEQVPAGAGLERGRIRGAVSVPVSVATEAAAKARMRA